MKQNNVNDELKMTVEFSLEKGYTKEDLDILNWIEDKRMERKH